MLKFSSSQVRLFAYAMAASTSIGAISTACSQVDHPATKPASGPCEKYGNRPVPPATGYGVPSSAYTSAKTVSITAACAYEMIAAGPAFSDAVNALRSHLAQMIDPSETNISPQNPTVRCKWPWV